jgi:hypothetical protein
VRVRKERLAFEPDREVHRRRGGRERAAGGAFKRRLQHEPRLRLRALLEDAYRPPFELARARVVLLRAEPRDARELARHVAGDESLADGLVAVAPERARHVVGAAARAVVAVAHDGVEDAPEEQILCEREREEGGQAGSTPEPTGAVCAMREAVSALHMIHRRARAGQAETIARAGPREPTGRQAPRAVARTHLDGPARLVVSAAWQEEVRVGHPAGPDETSRQLVRLCQKLGD